MWREQLVQPRIGAVARDPPRPSGRSDRRYGSAPASTRSRPSLMNEQLLLPVVCRDGASPAGYARVAGPIWLATLSVVRTSRVTDVRSPPVSTGSPTTCMAILTTSGGVEAPDHLGAALIGPLVLARSISACDITAKEARAIRTTPTSSHDCQFSFRRRPQSRQLILAER